MKLTKCIMDLTRKKVIVVELLNIVRSCLVLSFVSSSCIGCIYYLFNDNMGKITYFILKEDHITGHWKESEEIKKIFVKPIRTLYRSDIQ